MLKKIFQSEYSNNLSEFVKLEALRWKFSRHEVIIRISIRIRININFAKIKNQETY